MALIKMLVASSLVLAGAAPLKKCDQEKVAYVYVCPEIKKYTKAQLKALAEEMRKYDKLAPMMATIVDDNGNLRAGIKEACAKKETSAAR